MSYMTHTGHNEIVVFETVKISYYFSFFLDFYFKKWLRRKVVALKTKYTAFYVTVMAAGRFPRLNNYRCKNQTKTELCTKDPIDFCISFYPPHDYEITSTKIIIRII